MTSIQFSSGKYAFGFCDRCGFRYPYLELQEQMIDSDLSGIKVCSECLDIDHEQLRLGRTPIVDPQNLYDPRPDTAREGSVSLFGWNPVGNPLTGEAVASVGSVTVTIV